MISSEIKIPVSVVVVTRNEIQHIARCLRALDPFDEVIVIDSHSNDGTCEVVASFGVPLIPFTWNGVYPKKRQWVLDHINLKHPYVFFVDADEVVTPELCDEMRNLTFDCAGYFIKGRYVIGGKILRYGVHNNKLALFDRNKMEFPVVDDLDVEGMGEIEGHYQPVKKASAINSRIGQMRSPVIHYAMEDSAAWKKRQGDYLRWHRAVLSRNSIPQEDVFLRRALKKIVYCSSFGPLSAFVMSYVFKGGFMDGRAGMLRAKSLYEYYRDVRA
jgi:glycosyltransferase involved in cell wall biosynthesis